MHLVGWFIQLKVRWCRDLQTLNGILCCCRLKSCWYMTPCCLASSSQLFQRTLAPLSSGSGSYSHEAVQEDIDCLRRKMKAQCSLKHETTCWRTQQYVSEDLNLQQQHCCENLESCVLSCPVSCLEILVPLIHGKIFLLVADSWPSCY